jgi:hypothetical protein
MYSKTHVYVLTAASRTKDNPTVDRFLKSLHFDPLSKKGPAQTVISFSSLPTIKVEMLQDADYKPEKTGPAPKPPKDDGVTPLVVLSKPRASYTDAARLGNVQGNIRFKVTLSEDGSIPRVQLLGKGLRELLRQAFFSVMRIKFLPKLVDQRPIRSEITIDYGFNIY